MTRQSTRRLRPTAVALAAVFLVPGCSGDTAAQPEPMTSTGCSKPTIGKVGLQVSAQAEDGSPARPLAVTLEYERGSPDGVSGGPLTEVTPCVLAVVDLGKGAAAELGQGFELKSMMDDEEIDAAAGEGRLSVTDNAVRVAASGGNLSGFSGWYVNFSGADVGSYRWTAPAHWTQPAGTAVTGEVQVEIDVTA